MQTLLSGKMKVKPKDELIDEIEEAFADIAKGEVEEI